MALTVWRETPTASASCCWDISIAARAAFILRFFIGPDLFLPFQAARPAPLYKNVDGVHRIYAYQERRGEEVHPAHGEHAVFNEAGALAVERAYGDIDEGKRQQEQYIPSRAPVQRRVCVLNYAHRRVCPYPHVEGAYRHHHHAGPGAPRLHYCGVYNIEAGRGREGRPPAL